MDIASHNSRRFGWRIAGIALAIGLFALSVAELMLRAGSDAGTWRGLALSSLYLVLCLGQRRLFAPPRHRRR
ncbi:hypothetical protein [Rhodanobacter sp. DHG33]|uniref:hypothetical protein n=1 Tax=Rhodanobacter sp. DHG33 TaxID=2775921 RepID=UPI0017869322|nr:hypothetical protein [Rhodanobacter sp. DHG33]MBD8898963.1 hypothetical protein [Rhodanobacter sp. DHG33]